MELELEIKAAVDNVAEIKKTVSALKDENGQLKAAIEKDGKELGFEVDVKPRIIN